MNRQKWVILVTVLVVIGGAGTVLQRLKANQKLGVPGIKATPLPDSILMAIDLPEHVLDYASTNVPQAQEVLDWLPDDTSYAQRRYTAPDGFWVNANIVLMGMDRTSIHKPEFCLPGHGWRIEKKGEVDIPIGGPEPYSLRAARWTISNTMKAQDGGEMKYSGLYVFWFVADGELTTSHWQRIWWLSRDLVLTGVLQRWAYVSYFTVCAPGDEDATFERMQKLIETSVPHFQKPPAGAVSVAAAEQR